MDFQGTGKVAILGGVFLVFLGLLFFWQRIPFLGGLPGDIFIQKENSQFFLPIMTSIVTSIVLTIILNLVIRLFRERTPERQQTIRRASPRLWSSPLNIAIQF
jgi:phosphotransferase system  glucose/maltose/N-acetylglucosamine-specific IIC component